MARGPLVPPAACLPPALAAGGLAAAALLLAGIAALFHRLAPEPYMVRLCCWVPHHRAALHRSMPCPPAPPPPHRSFPPLACPLSPATILSTQDEPFHVPQTQRYCEGRWREWDPMITTLPGLYLLGGAAGRLHSSLFGLLAGVLPPQPCGTTVLRAVNAAAALACLPLFYAAAAAADPSRSRRQLLLMVRWARSRACPVAFHGGAACPAGSPCSAA